jgi:hypothetical protein
LSTIDQTVVGAEVTGIQMGKGGVDARAQLTALEQRQIGRE